MRGIIPRVLTYIFDEFERRKSVEYRMSVSFIEIYNEVAYDLLDKSHLDKQMENWNRIAFFEDDYGSINLRNVSVLECMNEQEGIDLLMTGNFIRQVSSTPMNQCSSRSHCVFTITIEGKIPDSETEFVSKLHLVDLAGSERVSKTNVDGTLLNEAKNINLSLTYLEQVIIALQARKNGKQKVHVPYRNSLMTTLLKDSLGGNCKTVMIANMSTESDNIDETISTARFAMRCAKLENEVHKNERQNLQIVIKNLENENFSLQKELEIYKTTFGELTGHKSSPSTNSTTPKQWDYAKVLSDVEDFLNENIEDIEFSSIKEAKIYFHSIREVYSVRMKEYVAELNYIQEKLQKYDEILTIKKERKRREKENAKWKSSPSYESLKGKDVDLSAFKGKNSKELSAIKEIPHEEKDLDLRTRIEMAKSNFMSIYKKSIN